ncbi:LysR family transcriptional regulator substrate-binding protein, partial [Streptomyces gardneri]|uniref:LysR family transcriptional regulator substrate-binding protein n=1 Tax=Streptomyces gardneri TaxID=66892 RepID=UPI0036990BB4
MGGPLPRHRPGAARGAALGTVDVVLGQRYHHMPEAAPQGVEISPLLDDPLLDDPLLDDPLLVVTAADRIGERPLALRELATHSIAVPPSGTDCGQAVLRACRQAGSEPAARYVTADISAQLALARAGLATALVPRTAVDPDVPGIRAASIEDRPIVRRL